MMMECIRKRFFAVLLAAALCLGLPGCGARTGGSVSPETENLAKLCKVWGYVKYRHPAFLLGKKDWDQELLKLIPQVREAESAEAVNELLHTWFVGLGEVDYGTSKPVRGFVTAGEDNQVYVADTTWIADPGCLGAALTEDLALISGDLPNADRSKAPDQGFDPYGMTQSRFLNEPEHTAAYDDPGFRLLGLFRLWNAVEYCFPYLQLMDRGWEDCLQEHIPRMLEGTSQADYEGSLLSLASNMKDPHVNLLDLAEIIPSFYTETFGAYFFPCPLGLAEERLVVTEAVENCTLEPGDVLLEVNGRDIASLAEEHAPYRSYPREDTMLYQVRDYITLSKTREIAVTVLRDGQELSLSVTGLDSSEYYSATGSAGDEKEPEAFETLDDGIVLINTAALQSAGLSAKMEAVRDTKGLVVDLRQYPDMALENLAAYLMPENIPAIVYAEPSMASPGTYLKRMSRFGYNEIYAKSGAYPYAGEVVVLIDGTSISRSENFAIILGQAETVTLLGSNTAGTDGNVLVLPLPGNLAVSFTSIGVYLPDGTQTQRVGVAPDIRVEPTIQGIKEGRDEVLEAAIAYIQDQS